MRTTIAIMALALAFCAPANAHLITKKPLREQSKRELRRELAHANGWLRFVNHNPYGRYVVRSCRRSSEARTQRAVCRKVRNGLRDHAWLRKASYARLHPAPIYDFGALNCVSCWDQVALCESGGNWHINTGNGFYGGLQWLLSTWISYGGTRYAPTPLSASRMEQIAVASHMSLGHWPWCGTRY